MKRSTAKVLLILNYVIMIALMLLNAGESGMMFLIGLVGVLIALVLSYFLRCPSCGRGQGRGKLFAQYCPYCGEPLDD